MKTINSTSELPDWFSLSLYEHLIKISEAEILNEIEKRQNRYSDLVYGGVACTASPYPLSRDSERHDSPGDLVAIVIGKALENTPLVVSTEALDFAVNGKDLLDKFCTQENDDIKIISKRLLEFNINEFARENTLSHEYSPQGGLDKAHITVNIEAKDSEIIQDFTQYLKKFREKYNAPEPIETERMETVFGKIRTYRAIPYLDLMIWAESENKTIKNSVFANALYPDGSKGDRDIRDYTKKYAKRAISNGFISSAWSWVKRKSASENPSQKSE